MTVHVFCSWGQRDKAGCGVSSKNIPGGIVFRKQVATLFTENLCVVSSVIERRKLLHCNPFSTVAYA